MFDIGMGEILVLLIVALLVFGPDRLPAMAKQSAGFVRDLRTMVANARRDLSDSVGDLGIDGDDLKTLSDLRNPRSFVRRRVLDGVDFNASDLGVDDLGIDDADEKPARRQTPRRPATTAGAKARTVTTGTPINNSASRAVTSNGAATVGAAAAETAGGGGPAIGPDLGVDVGADAPAASVNPPFDPDAT